jgi:hypothetical protein
MRASHLLAPAVVFAAGVAVLGPRPLRQLARAGEALYAASLVAAGVRALSAAEEPGDAALVPVALAVMHFAHGIGQIQGWLKYGPPLAAVAELAGMHQASQAAPEPVYAPSLGLKAA